MAKKLAGMPVKDATRPIRLEIQPKDITEAKRKNHGHCAAANACLRQLHCSDVRIHIARVYIRRRGGFWIRYETPKSLRTEIVAFDRGGSFAPGVHILRPFKKRPRHKPSGPNSSKGTRDALQRSAHIIAGVRAHA